MYRKLLLSIFVLSPFFMLGQSSAVDAGIKIGINASTLRFRNDGETLDDNVKGGAGFAGGAFVRFNLNGFMLQPELMYSQKRFSESADGQELGYKLDDIDFAIALGGQGEWADGNRWRLYTGPVISFNLSTELEFEGVSVSGDDVGELFNSPRLALILGAGLDLGPVVVDVRFVPGITNTIDPDQVEPEDTQTPLEWFQFSLGYRITK